MYGLHSNISISRYFLYAMYLGYLRITFDIVILRGDNN